MSFECCQSSCWYVAMLKLVTLCVYFCHCCFRCCRRCQLDLKSRCWSCRMSWWHHLSSDLICDETDVQGGLRRGCFRSNCCHCVSCDWNDEIIKTWSLNEICQNFTFYLDKTAAYWECLRRTNYLMDRFPSMDRHRCLMDVNQNLLVPFWKMIQSYIWTWN